MIHWFTKNHVAANILMLAILIVGSWMFIDKLGVETEPAFKLNHIRVNVPLPGGSPEEVEKSIILPVEKALEDMSEIKHIEARASNGMARISIEGREYSNLEALKLEIESRVQRINTFPQESEKPRVRVLDTSNWHEVITVAVSGDFSEEELLKAARKVRDDLTAKPGISKVDIHKPKNKEISINLIPEKLNAFNLTFDDVNNSIRNNSIDLSAGSINENGERVTIRSTNKAYTGAEFRKLIIRKSANSEILLEDIANVEDAFEENVRTTTFNNRKAILVEVLRKDGENALEIADTVHAYIETQKKSLPAGLYLDAWDDDSISLRGRIHTLVVNLIQGGILVMILLGLFLRPSVAFWVTIGIPVSFAGAAISMYLFGVTINNMSLFGFIIVLGIVVDDAIVTGENIFAKARTGKYSALESAVLGTKEVAVPVTFGVVTTMAAFVPLMIGDDYLSNMAKQIPFVVIPVLIFSLIESKFILPAHLKHIRQGEPKESDRNWLYRLRQTISNSMDGFVKIIYQPLLKLSIKFKYGIIMAFFAILVLTLTFFKTNMKFVDFPSVERYYLYAHLQMKQGTELEATTDAVNRITSQLEELKKTFVDKETGKSLIQNIVTITGGSRWGDAKETKGAVMVEITPPSQRSSEDVTNKEIVKAWRDKIGEIDGSSYFMIMGDTGQSRRKQSDNGLKIQLRGLDEEAKLAVAEKFEAWARTTGVLNNPRNDAEEGERELQVRQKPGTAAMSDKKLASQIRTAFHGTKVQKIQRGEDEINVMLRFPEDVRKSMHTLDTLRINLGNGKKTAPLTQFAEVVETMTPPEINRENGSRIMHIRATAKADVELISLEPMITEKLNELCAAHPSVSWKYLGNMADHNKRQKEFLVKIIGLMLVLFALLAIPFKSFLQPFYVLLAVPFGIIGAIWGHWIMDVEVTYLSLVGIIALAGVVVNDSLVLVDYINQKRLEGVSLSQAVREAGARRFRPIILTSITTFAGLMPILFENSIQAQFLIPMAISLAFGILFATAITLLLIPCAYMIGEDIKGYLMGYFRWQFSLNKSAAATVKSPPPLPNPENNHD